MEDNPTIELKRKIKGFTILFIVFLVLSGLTAFPIESEIQFLDRTISENGPLGVWIARVNVAVQETNENHPMLSYGTDWLAFAHLMIAVAFIGPLRDPVRNIWVYQFGMIACISIIPIALIMGPIRDIPFFWQLIDCSFGLFGVIPLYLCYKWSRELELAVN